MISSLLITGYRGFEHFEIPDLGRINLLVGTNNSGKTSVLEVVSILESAGDLSRLWNILWKRGERTVRTLPPLEKNLAPRPIAEVDVGHIFYGHEIHPGTRLSITAKNESPQKYLELEIIELSVDEKIDPQFVEDSDDNPLPRMALHMTGNPSPTVPLIALSRNYGISSGQLRRPNKRPQPKRPVQFITTESSSVEEVMAAWNTVSLKPEEKLVLQALQALDSNIQGIALQARTPQQYWGQGNRGGFMVKLKSVEQPVPIGSMGDGIWRMLALSIAIAQSKGGTLLVDEIDTGLHYTVMSKMWNLIYSAAKEFNVQVFATTHSYDCVYSLAQICEDADAHEKITVQRIEANKQQSVPYDQEEISVAAAREIEVR
jgi:ABC-type branched-subunit amino acid transport system ATPase component